MAFAFYVIIGTLAAFGVFCAAFALFGCYFGCKQGSFLVYLCSEGEDIHPVVCRYRMLRGLGLFCGPLLLVESSVPPDMQQRLKGSNPGIRFCSLQQLPAILCQEEHRLV